MKKSDLHRERARVLDMCEGTKVDSLMCWKEKGCPRPLSCGFAPEFTADPDTYEFAVAILEDKPVFVGDNVYAKLSGERFDWDDPDHVRQIKCENLSIDPEDVWTWKPPKKTFMLNGEELPCPDGNKGGYQISLLSGRHYFSNFHDAQKVANAFDKLLSDNTK